MTAHEQPFVVSIRENVQTLCQLELIFQELDQVRIAKGNIISSAIVDITNAIENANQRLDASMDEIIPFFELIVGVRVSPKTHAEFSKIVCAICNWNAFTDEQKEEIAQACDMMQAENTVEHMIASNKLDPCEAKEFQVKFAADLTQRRHETFISIDDAFIFSKNANAAVAATSVISDAKAVVVSDGGIKKE